MYSYKIYSYKRKNATSSQGSFRFITAEFLFFLLLFLAVIFLFDILIAPRPNIKNTKKPWEQSWKNVYSRVRNNHLRRLFYPGYLYSKCSKPFGLSKPANLNG